MDRIILKTSRRTLVLGDRTWIMGILNVTPDSFSDGGAFDDLDRAVAQGERLCAEGADILDIGGESSRPGADPVSAEEEIRRVVPAVRILAGLVETPISVDTTKAAVARAALAAGAEIVNDISALRFDREMRPLAASTGAGVVLMHMRGRPKDMQTGDLAYADLTGEIRDFFRERIAWAAAGGIAPEQVLLDPGIGFGKTGENNLRILRCLRDFACLGRPLLVGPSRKAFVGTVTGGGPGERLEGTAAAVTAAILEGAHLVRVHDVAPLRKVAAMADALARA